MRLNGWHRIGIVLSSLFMIVVSVYQRLKQADLEFLLYRIANEAKSRCIENVRANVPAPPAGFVLDAEAACIENYEKEIERIFSFTDVKIIDLLYHAVFPVIAAWIIVYFLLFTFRWIRGGFRDN